MAAVSDGFLAPRGEDAFGVDDEATVGDFLGALYILIGGTSADAQACLDTLVSYGLADASTDLNAPLTEGYAAGLLASLGSEFSTDDPDHVMTRGELANLLEGD